MNPIAVEGGGYTSACGVLYDGNHAVFDALSTLSETLSGCFDMAGGDQTGQAWAGEYDKAAAQLAEAGSKLCDIFARVANLTNTSLANHDAADGGSTYDQARSYGSSIPPDDPDPSHSAESIYFGVVSATGAPSDPDWWHWVASYMQGWFYPNADTGRLRVAGQAWAKAGEALQYAGAYATTAADYLAVERSPEIASATMALDALDRHCCDLGSAYVAIGSACNDYATLVDTLHQNVQDQLTSFWEWTAGIEIAGGIVSFFTAGMAEAPTQMVEGAECANAAAKVLDLIKALSTAIQESTTVQAVLAQLARIFPRLEKFLTAEKDVAEVEEVAVAAARSGLIDELAANGVKFSRDDIVTIFKDADGRIVFLETGSDSAGLKHIILEHGAQFANKGVAEQEIPGLLQRALTHGTIVANAEGTRPIYEVTFNGVLRRVAITVGKNGYIVGAHIK